MAKDCVSVRFFKHLTLMFIFFDLKKPTRYRGPELLTWGFSQGAYNCRGVLPKYFVHKITSAFKSAQGHVTEWYLNNNNNKTDMESFLEERDWLLHVY